MPKQSRRRSADRAKPLRRIRALPKLPRRRRDGHKGKYGRVLILGGSRGMIGAPALAANAALRSGAGLATVACPRSIQPAVATLCPCATTIPLPETAAGLLDPRRTAKQLGASGLLGGPAAPSVVAAGPGLGRGNEAFDRAWLALLDEYGRAHIPVVLDADGLNTMHKSSDWAGPGWDETPRFRTVITPHPGEMARLHNATAGAVQRDRETFAIHTARLMSAGSPTDTSGATLEKMPDTADRKTDTAHRGGGQGTGAGSAFPASQDHRSVVVLKGAGTIVTDGISLYVNKTGNPGMATGGSGDVLTGVIAALIGQGLSCFDAAVLGVHVHGLAGDRAAEQLGEVSLTASDLIDYLPAALRRTLQTPPRPRR